MCVVCGAGKGTHVQASVSISAYSDERGHRHAGNVSKQSVCCATIHEHLCMACVLFCLFQLSLTCTSALSLPLSTSALSLSLSMSLWRSLVSIVCVYLCQSRLFRSLSRLLTSSMHVCMYVRLSVFVSVCLRSFKYYPSFSAAHFPETKGIV